MTNPKNLTELAMCNQQRAQEERRNGDLYRSRLGDRDGDALAESFAKPFERKAAELLTLPSAPDVGPGGEVCRTHPAPNGAAVTQDPYRWVVRNTLSQGATRIAEDASSRRTALLLQPGLNALALALDAAESIGAANSLEKMLTHQMTVAHEAAMRMMARALSYEDNHDAGDQVEACRCINAAARLMSAFQDGLLTIQRLRTGGNQTVTVQHVSVEAGVQAVIGNVQAGEAKRRGDK